MAIAQSSPRMPARVATLFRRADAAEYQLCLRLNSSCRVVSVRKLFAIISRLGDGVFWYTLMLLLPIVYGERGLYPSLRMALAGVVGLALYKYLKARLVRERPFINFTAVVAGATVLDRYSFPSGHTLHAVSFTILICSSFPQLAWLCVPFAALVAISRVVLGLHYPSDVLAGATLGASVATVTLWLLPL